MGSKGGRRFRERTERLSEAVLARAKDIFAAEGIDKNVLLEDVLLVNSLSELRESQGIGFRCQNEVLSLASLVFLDSPDTHQCLELDISYTPHSTAQALAVLDSFAANARRGKGRIHNHAAYLMRLIRTTKEVGEPGGNRRSPARAPQKMSPAVRQVFERVFDPELDKAIMEDVSLMEMLAKVQEDEAISSLQRFQQAIDHRGRAAIKNKAGYLIGFLRQYNDTEADGGGSGSAAPMRHTGGQHSHQQAISSDMTTKDRDNRNMRPHRHDGHHGHAHHGQGQGQGQRSNWPLQLLSPNVRSEVEAMFSGPGYRSVLEDHGLMKQLSRLPEQSAMAALRDFREASKNRNKRSNEGIHNKSAYLMGIMRGYLGAAHGAPGGSGGSGSSQQQTPPAKAIQQQQQQQAPLPTGKAAPTKKLWDASLPSETMPPPAAPPVPRNTAIGPIGLGPIGKKPTSHSAATTPAMTPPAANQPQQDMDQPVTPVGGQTFQPWASPVYDPAAQPSGGFNSVGGIISPPCMGSPPTVPVPLWSGPLDSLHDHFRQMPSFSDSAACPPTRQRHPSDQFAPDTPFSLHQSTPTPSHVATLFGGTCSRSVLGPELLGAEQLQKLGLEKMEVCVTRESQVPGVDAMPMVSAPTTESMSHSTSGSNSATVPGKEGFMVHENEGRLAEFLAKVGLLRYQGVFRDAEMDVDALMLVQDKDLEELGLPKGPRVKLLHAQRERLQQRVY